MINNTIPKYSNFLTSINKKHSKVSFNGMPNPHNCENIVYAQVGKDIVCQTTSFFRNDLNWDRFASYLINKFPSGAKIYDSACSNGAEVYSLMLKLAQACKGKSKDIAKLFTFEARDVGAEIIKKDQKGLIDLSQKDVFNLSSYIPTFFKSVKQADAEVLTFQVSPELKSKVNFAVEDITKFAENAIDHDVVMFRNSWYHLPEPEQKKLAQDLYNNMKPGSILVIGEHEYPQQMRFIEEAGFTKVRSHKSFNPDMEDTNEDYNIFNLQDKVCLIYEKSKSLAN